jgi:pimeloyl-ACP methyl ester carboxylesterase
MSMTDPGSPVLLPVGDGAARVAATLHHLDVPVRHAQPDGPRRRLAYARLAATTRHPGPPIVLLAGGPGESGIESLDWPGGGRPELWAALRQLGDVIALDQRGTGWSHPVPLAPAPLAMPLDHAVDAAEALAHAEAAVALMREAWAGHDDLGAYTVLEAADDVAALADALGAERVRLLGASYGSHLGLAVLRRHPHRVECATLSLVEGPDHTYKLPSLVDASLRHLAELAAASPEAAGGHPDLLGDLEAALAKLRERPRAVPCDAASVVVGPFDLQRAVAGCLGDAPSLALLPSRIRAIGRGDLRWLAHETVDRRLGWPASAMSWHTDAASGATSARRARIEEEATVTLLGDAINHPFPGIERALGLPDIGDANRAPVAVDRPVQLLSGTLDGRTPAANGDEVAAALPRSGHLVVEGLAHEEGLASAAVRERVVRFLAGDDPADGRLEVPFRFRRP